MSHVSRIASALFWMSALLIVPNLGFWARSTRDMPLGFQRRLPPLELHQDIHVAAGEEVVAKDGAEQPQELAVMLTAKLGDPLGFDGDLGRRHVRASVEKDRRE